MASILIRTVIIYTLLTAALRIMGKRQIGELDVSDLVSTLLISELAAIPIDDPDIPLMNAVLPIIFIFSLEVLLSTVKNKSEKLKSMLDGDACFIIYKGRLLQSALKDNRISVNELMSAVRAQGIGDLKDVEYAILEQNGSISVLEANKAQMAHTIVIDGEPIKAECELLGWDRRKIEKKLKKSGADIKDVFLMTVDDQGEINIIKKEDKTEKKASCGGGNANEG